jgi:hypothetical protein
MPLLLLLLLLLCAGCSFASAAGHVEVFRHNIFIPHQQLRGKFNKVGRHLQKATVQSVVQ